MKASPSFPRRDRGHALMMVLIILAVSLALLGSVLLLTANESSITARNNLYNTSIAAAEAATEKVLSQMSYDFINGNVSSNLSAYGSQIPAQTGWPVQFAFSDNSGHTNQTGIQTAGTTTSASVDPRYTGLYGIVTPYQVVSTATPLTQTNLSATVSQSFQLSLIPIYQFAIFYSLDMEINPGVNMKVNGKVHSNGQLYSAPGAPVTLEFQDDVTAVGNIIYSRNTNDPAYGSGKSTPILDVPFQQVSSLNLPIGTNNSPTAVQQILEPAPGGEDPNSALGKSRFYNLSDLVVSNSASGIVVKAGAWDNFVTIPPDVTNTATPYYSFVTNSSFYDFREGKTVQSTDIDVAKLQLWMTNSSARGGSSYNNSLKAYKNHGLNSVYVLDRRSQSGSTVSAARAVNGAQLPSDGLTIATPMPMYVKGNFNLNNGDTSAGLTNTANTKPAALVGDSISVLSTNWSDTYTSGTDLSARNSGNTTVNAAIIAGIVESATVGGTGHYSGGVENFPRLLENWSGTTLTYNGSMVALFASHYATNFWQPTGNYYNAPTRKWAFDMNFLDKDKLPPVTPQLRVLSRTGWQILASN